MNHDAGSVGSVFKHPDQQIAVAVADFQIGDASQPGTGQKHLGHGEIIGIGGGQAEHQRVLFGG